MQIDIVLSIQNQDMQEKYSLLYTIVLNSFSVVDPNDNIVSKNQLYKVRKIITFVILKELLYAAFQGFKTPLPMVQQYGPRAINHKWTLLC
jgi:hypothetical protein